MTLHLEHPAAPVDAEAPADVCLFVEGAYPFVPGGVSEWVHQLITSQKHLSFHLVALVSDAQRRTAHYEPPANVLSLQRIVLQHEPGTCPEDDDARAFMQALAAPLDALLREGGHGPLRQVMRLATQHRRVATLPQLLNSRAAYELAQRMYEASVPRGAFLPYFWSWRSMVAAVFAVLLSRLPKARVYHAVSTGYAGLAMARASIQTGRPGLVTEHGIYTNERRIEIAMADWLVDSAPPSLSIEGRREDLRDVWMRAFEAHARSTYACAKRIVTLYEGNQDLQARDGALRARMSMIPNGVDVRRLRTIERSPNKRRPTVALVGRVVPIKDVKTFIRAAQQLRELVPGVRVLVVGPRDEDRDYHRACVEMVSHLGLSDTVEFKGPIETEKVLTHLDVLVLTSLSEAQPLVMLEAGAAGIPCVATDVGACREIIEGRRGEFPPLPAGGIVTPLASPGDTAQALARLLRDNALRERCGRALKERVRRYYNQKMVKRSYRELYASLLTAPTTRDSPMHTASDDDPLAA